MKGVSKLFARSVLVLLCLTPAVAGQTGDFLSPNMDERMPERRQRSYDGETKQTKVRHRLLDDCRTSWNIQFGGSRSFCNYMLYAAYTFPGHELKQPVETVTLEVFTQPAAGEWGGETWASVDGEKIPLAAPERVPNPQWRLLRVDVPAAAFMRIANGRDVTITVGGSRHRLKGEHLKRLRELAGGLAPRR
jgi:hypothetical protein